MTANLLDNALRAALKSHRDSLAVADLTRRLTYAELDAAATTAAEDLAGAFARAGVSAHRVRLAIRAKNGPSYVVAFLAALRCAAVPFLIDPSLSDAEFDTIVASCGLDAVVHDGEAPAIALETAGLDAAPGLSLSRLPATEAARPELLADTEVCRFSSGSTRSPACIEFRGRAVLNAAAAWTLASGLQSTDTVLCFAGLYNGLAFNTSLVPGLMSGAALYLPRGLPSASNVHRHVEAARPQILVGFPALYDGLVRRQVDRTALGGVRIALSSAAKLDPDTASVAAERYGLRIADYYGIAETGPLTFNADPRPDGGQGATLPGVEVRVVGVDVGTDGCPPEGSLEVRSSSMGSRYLNYPGEFEGRVTSDGFYRTGDEGSLVGDQLVLTGRSGKALNVGGRKVSRDEVADAILRHPDVTDCAVLGVPNDHGATVIAAVVATKSPVEADAIRQHCLARLAAFKVPERVVFADSVPRNGAGKPSATELAALVARAGRR